MTSATFFRGLNPMSEKSGIHYESTHARGRSTGQSEMQDETLWNYISNAWKDKGTTAAQSIAVLNNAIMGHHYKQTDSSLEKGNKGMLDFFFFPLVARKLIHFAMHHSEIPSNKSIGTSAAKAAAFIVGAILEIPRLAIGLVFTLLLSPVALLLNCLKKSCCCSRAKNDMVKDDRVRGSGLSKT